MDLLRKDPEAAYYSNQLWLPRSYVSEQQLRGALTYDLGPSKDPYEAFQTEAHHFLAPRNYIDTSAFGALPFPVYDARLRRFPRIRFKSHVVLDAKQPDQTYQRDAVAALVGTENGILCLRCGAGKALAHGEPVLTTTGWRPIEELTVGNEIIGSDGNAYPVTGVFPQGRVQLYDITFSDGTVVTASGDHLWEVGSQSTFYRGDRTKVLTTEEMLAKGLSYAGGQFKFFVRQGSALPGTTQKLPIEPYLLGVLLGDGGLSQLHINISTDREIINALELPEDMEISEREHITDEVHTVALTSRKRGNPLRAKLDELGLRCRSEHKVIPDIYMCGSIAQRLALLQGLLDTDGTPEKQSVEFSSSSKRLAEQVRELVQSLGGLCHFVERQTYYTYSEKRLAGLPSYRCMLSLPPNMAPFRLSRKARKLQPRRRTLSRSIRSITKTKKGEATCISVAAPDRLFRTRNHILTHNTVCCIHALSLLETPALVLVNDKGLAEQWVEEIVAFTDLRREDIGFIGDGEFSWQGKAITIGLVQTVAGRVRAGTLPRELVEWFGVVVADEAHTTAGPAFFGLAVTPFHGRRWGLSATPRRDDAFDSLLRYALGRVVYTYLEPELTPLIYFRRLPTRINMKDPKVREAVTDVSGELHLQRLYAHLATREDRMGAIIKEIQTAVRQKREVLVLSQSRAVLERLEQSFPDAGVVHGGVLNRKERLRRIREQNPVIAIAQLGRQALNKPKLDALFLCEPFTKRAMIQQLIGRVQRTYAGKQQPLVVIYEDIDIEPMRAMCMKMRSWFAKWPEHMGGKMKWQNVGDEGEHERRRR